MSYTLDEVKDRVEGLEDQPTDQNFLNWFVENSDDVIPSYAENGDKAIVLRSGLCCIRLVMRRALPRPGNEENEIVAAFEVAVQEVEDEDAVKEILDHARMMFAMGELGALKDNDEGGFNLSMN